MPSFRATQANRPDVPLTVSQTASLVHSGSQYDCPEASVEHNVAVPPVAQQVGPPTTHAAKAGTEHVTGPAAHRPLLQVWLPVHDPHDVPKSSIPQLHPSREQLCRPVESSEHPANTAPASTSNTNTFRIIVPSSPTAAPSPRG
jgi:hypothetical protein